MPTATFFTGNLWLWGNSRHNLDQQSLRQPRIYAHLFTLLQEKAKQASLVQFAAKWASYIAFNGRWTTKIADFATFCCTCFIRPFSIFCHILLIATLPVQASTGLEQAQEVYEYRYQVDMNMNDMNLQHKTRICQSRRILDVLRTEA